MTWLVPFLTGVVKGFMAELADAPAAARPAGRPQSLATIAASGRVGGMVWVAVPYEHAAAFEAAHPRVYSAASFFRVVARSQFSEPEGYRLIQPFVREVLAAIEQYGDDCQILVAHAEDAHE
jgi:hypothetical protein